MPRIANVDVDLSDFLMEGNFDASFSEVGSDMIGYDASTESHLHQYAFPAPPVTVQEGFHEMHCLNIAERTTKYLEKLYEMLEQCPESIVTWTQDGTAFAVLNADAFERTIIPRFFKPIKFESFVRQLNSYGFRKAKHKVSNKAVFAFRHTNFVRGEAHKLQTIQRRRRSKRASPLPAHALTVDPTSEEGLSARVQISLETILAFVRTLQKELADTNALVQALVNCEPAPPLEANSTNGAQ
ncbi:hypothetical protein H310_06435 [Aphanomyces invadans]|uniref:HSF-type DNA-binding domain-containing protein n=1 Tax=Aphanomyces invadans TaxID=157072 RepID=A0A024U8G5_9STRA|nr:hypothetical protein H310_06435 [Aphanomyces invadans]ETW01873.1 hypothetical protein H310_06435 [Aphanomyces invadans]|eukprot:XP_008869721.1 hypothetical protein H310_06435 [Aphanomyces invadans]